MGSFVQSNGGIILAASPENALEQKEIVMPSKRPVVEEFQVTGHQLVTSIKDLIHQGNIRRISIRNENGVTLLEIPLVVGLAGAVLVPIWAAVGAFAALVAKCTLVVERVDGGPPKPRAPRKKKKNGAA
jgi:hypothetical protein